MASNGRNRTGRRVFVHEEVFEALERHAQLRKRASMEFQRLVAHGSAPWKACRDDANRGWRRSALGGGGSGQHYYLWWAPGTAPPVGRLREAGCIEGDDIVVRAVRHHDEHRPLGAGWPDRFEAFYRRLSHEEVFHIPAPAASHDQDKWSPWTERQLAFVHGAEPVRTLRGYPGTGKTTALWLVVETRPGERVLYVTWTRALAELARQRFRSSVGEDDRLLVLDFRSLVGRILGRDVPRVGIVESRRRLAEQLRTLPRKIRKRWERYVEVVLEEVRAHMVGAMTPGRKRNTGTSHPRKPPILREEVYLRNRVEQRRARLSYADAKALHRLARTPTIRDVLPELVGDVYAALEALDRLRAGADLPEELRDLDRIVVDEVQDLTQVEVALLVELARAVGRTREDGRMPFFVAAGDEGQRVMPSGFTWAGLHRQLRKGLDRDPEKFRLGRNLRSPAAIEDVLQRVSERYDALDKKYRPKGAAPGERADDWEVRLYHVVARDEAQVVELVEALATRERFVLLHPTETAEDRWLPRRSRAHVLRPMDVKGLDRYGVCLLRPGRVLAELAEPLDEKQRSVDMLSRRMLVDQLRVVLSRATHTLALVDVEGDPGRRLCAELLGQPIRCGVAEFLEALEREEEERSIEEYVADLVGMALQLVEHDPRRALQRIERALAEIGANPALPGTVADRDLRRRTLFGAIRIALTVLADVASRAGGTAGVDLEPETDRTEAELEGIAREAMARAVREGLADGSDEVLLREALGWLARTAMPPWKLLQAADRAVRREGTHWTDQLSWLFEPLRSVREALVRGASPGEGIDPKSAELLVDLVLEVRREARRSEPSPPTIVSRLRRFVDSSRGRREWQALVLLEASCVRLLEAGDDERVAALLNAWWEPRGRHEAGSRPAGGRGFAGAAQERREQGGTRVEAAGGAGRDPVEEERRTRRRIEARLHEFRAEYPQAVAMYDELDMAADALRCLRLSGNWPEALRRARRELPEHHPLVQDLTWLASIIQRLDEAPRDVAGRLTDAERHALARRVLPLLGEHASTRSGEGEAGSRTGTAMSGVGGDAPAPVR